MTRRISPTVLAGVVGLVTIVSAADSGFAQVPQFRDEKTGKVWTPENVSKDNQAPSQQTMPMTQADKAFDPNRQNITLPPMTQRPRGNLMGTVPVTAGPSVPIATLDSASLQAVPQQNWVTVIYVTNNSGGVIDAVVNCQFTNGGRPVQDVTVTAPPSGPGERWGLPVYGPRVDIFVDRVTCRLISPP
ncbi:MAG: hypothetical protein IKE60_26760 [Reyranella sp.]|uniref:hypothetical protein n=1 Tax=Reyranella sp. TaxID=1929291 RepID=UPI0025CC3B83|nr:hypothetical protein [Reyranella sp.]MBR2818293.1 hypothetical protein [Reyranella sp.]